LSLYRFVLGLRYVASFLHESDSEVIWVDSKIDAKFRIFDPCKIRGETDEMPECHLTRSKNQPLIYFWRDALGKLRD